MRVRDVFKWNEVAQTQEAILSLSQKPRLSFLYRHVGTACICIIQKEEVASDVVFPFFNILVGSTHTSSLEHDSQLYLVVDGTGRTMRRQHELGSGAGHECSERFREY